MNQKLIATAISGLLAAPMAAHAVKYKLSGQVNRAVVWADDGDQSDVAFVDNANSGTRWRMLGSEDLGNGMKVGFAWEWQVSSNSSSSNPMRSGDTGTAQAMRKAEVWFSGGWGKLSVGQGDGAGNGTTEVDLSQTWNVAYTQRQSIGGSIAWRTVAGGTTAGGLRRKDTTNAFDAFSRYDRVRYDTPALGPVKLSASFGQADKWEVAGRLSMGFGGGQLSAAMFYGESGGGPGSGGTDGRYGGSAAYLFSQGTNVMISGAIDEPGGDEDANNYYVKLGHNWGNTSASFSYGETEDFTPGFTNQGLQIAINHNLPKAKVDLYAGYQFNELDVVPSGTLDVEDINIITIGTKLKFD